MTFTIEHNTAFVYQNTSSVSNLIQEFELNAVILQSNHIILCLDKEQDNTDELLGLVSELSKNQKNINRSFVVVSSKFTAEAWPEDIALAPTKQEAMDIIDMDDMQRDLGF
jgi:hypothetical protein